MHDLLPDFPRNISGCCVSLGNFDGVHLGHRRILAELRRMGDALNCPTLAVTFDPHPIALLRPGAAPPLLTTIPQRLNLLRAAEVDEVYCISVTEDLLRMTAREFFDAILIDCFAIRGIAEGPNFMFGKDRSGDIEALGQFCASAGVECRAIDLASDGQSEYSSSRIRRLLSGGNVRAANAILGWTYKLTGDVQHGDGRGRELGFPTANLGGCVTLVPGDGVYAAVAEVNGVEYAAAVNIGPNPTFQTMRSKVECHLLDFDGDLYGSRITIKFVDRIRSVRKFSSVNDLRDRIAQDVDTCRAVVTDDRTISPL